MPRPRAFEVLGVYGEHVAQVDIPLDWKGLAERHLRGFRATRPLPPRLLAQVRDDRERGLDVGFPNLVFDVPLGEAPEGALFTLDVQGVRPVRAAGLRGAVRIWALHEDGCDAGPRQYSGGYVLSFPRHKRVRVPSGREVPRRGGLLLRTTDAFTATWDQLDARFTSGDRLLVTVSTRPPGPQRRWTVAAPGPGRIVGALLLTARETDERFVYLHVEDDSNCSTQVALFLLGPAPVQVAFGARDCDV